MTHCILCQTLPIVALTNRELLTDNVEEEYYCLYHGTLLGFIPEESSESHRLEYLNSLRSLVSSIEANGQASSLRELDLLSIDGNAEPMLLHSILKPEFLGALRELVEFIERNARLPMSKDLSETSWRQLFNS